MSTEQIKNLEQHSDSHIAEVVAEHPKVFAGGIADEKSKTDAEENWKLQNKIFAKLKEQKAECFEASKIKTQKAEFRKLYEEINPTKEENEKNQTKLGENEKKLKIENLVAKFHELMITMIKADIYQKTKIHAKKFGLSLTEEELKQKVADFRLRDYGEFNWQINNEGKLERTCYFDWIGEKLEKITDPKIDFRVKKDSENSLVDNLILQIYKNSIKETNAHFFGIVKTRQQIDELENNKADEIKKQNDERKSQNSQNSAQKSVNSNELYFCP